jgi:histidinol phosphatase-like enzyme (inositol monophosphatase family)
MFAQMFVLWFLWFLMIWVTALRESTDMKPDRKEKSGNHEEYWNFALELAHASAQAILPHFRRLTEVENKDHLDFDPVTVADRAGEARMRKLIEERFPDHGIIGEEYGNKETRSGYSWVLDPIDGTKSFVIGFPAWATLIGLMHEGRPQIGLMNQPYIGETFIGSRHAGTFLIRGERRAPLRVSPTKQLSNANAGTIGPERYKANSQIAGLKSITSGVRMIRYGGDAYFYCLLASGLLDIAMDADLQPYDIIPLIPIVEGAGGHIGTWTRGDPARGGNILSASTEALFEEALAVITS